MKAALIFFIASLIPAMACELESPYENEKITEEKSLFFGFQLAMTEEEVSEYVELYNSQSKLVQELVRKARFESESIYLGEDKTIRDLVSDVDYISISEVEYQISTGAEKLYLIDLAVGGGNGAYMYYKKVETETGVEFKKVYENFDGDIFYCATGY
ncbi:MAG: hypothetical protein CME64_07870 [Halobacteriovoraceae bacterium]|nr:hypothetical protein [Halobacteriovoraceae bacterium]|tara:strand:+ start:255 stop:725 length:471 start_codon:yes stop_codon:yes gene_type:complete